MDTQLKLLQDKGCDNVNVLTPAMEVSYDAIVNNKYYKNQQHLFLPTNPYGKETGVVILNPTKESAIRSINSDFIVWRKYGIRYMTSDVLYKEKIGSTIVRRNYINELPKLYSEELDAHVAYRRPNMMKPMADRRASIIHDISEWQELFFQYRLKKSLQVSCDQYIKFTADKISKTLPFTENYKNKIIYISYEEWRKSGATIGLTRECMNNPISVILVCLYKFQALLKPLIDLKLELVIVNEKEREFLKLKLTPDMLYPNSAKMIYSKFKVQLKRMHIYTFIDEEEPTEVMTEKVPPEEELRRQIIVNTMVRRFTGQDISTVENEPQYTVKNENGKVVKKTPAPITNTLETKPKPVAKPSAMIDTSLSVSETEELKNDEDPSVMMNEQLTDEITDVVNNFLDNNPELSDQDPETINDIIEDEVKEKVFVNKYMPERSKKALKLIEAGYTKQNEILSQDMEEMASKIIDETDFGDTIETNNDYIKSSKFVNFDKSYNEKKYRRDINNAVAALSNADIKVFIESIEEEDTSDVFNQKKTLTYHLRDEFNHTHTLKFDVPIIIDDCYIFMGGSKKYILKQRIFKPIVKIGPDQVQICTMYKKCTVFRHGKAVDSKTAAVKKELIKNDKYHVKYGNAKVKNTKYKTTLDFDYMSKSITKFNIGTHKFILDINELIDVLRENDVDVTPFEEGKSVPVGYTVKNGVYEPILLGESFTDTIYDMIPENDRANIKYSKTGQSQLAYARMKILDKFIPVVYFLLLCRGFDELMDKTGIQYEIFNTEKEIIAKYGKNYGFTYGTIQLKDCIVIWNKYPFENQLLMNGTYGLPLEEYTFDELNNRDTYIDMVSMYYTSSNQVMNLDQYKDFLIDPKTEEILRDFNLPTDLIGVFFYACKLLVNNQYSSPNDLINMRVRGNEIVSQIAYQCVVNAYGNYRKTAYKKNPSKITVNPNCVMSALATATLIEDESILNPVMTLDKTHTVNIKASTSVTGVSLSGINKTDGYTMAKRAYDESMVGIFASTTDHAANNGIIRLLTLEPNITSTNGYIDITPKDEINELNMAQLMTPAELLTPGSMRHDDPQRTGMMRSQTTHMVLTDEMTPVLIGNKVESIVPYHMHNEFCFVAKQDGKVIDVQDGIYILEYKDGTHDSFDSNPVIKKNSADGMYVELEFSTNLEVGDKFKKNEVIAAEKRAFTKNTDDISASMNIGVLAKVAITSIDDILEDSEPMTKKLSEQLAYYAIVKKTKALPANSTVDRMVKIGDHVNIGDPLIVFDNHNGDEEVAKFLEEYSKALNDNNLKEELVESNSTSMKATDSGEIIDIKMYYTVDISELSPSLQKIVKAYNQKINKKNKFLDQYKNENDNEYYKCGQLLTETSEKSVTYYGKVKGEDVGNGILIEFYIKHKDIIKKGDKATNFCALKGVVSHVIEEGQEPWSEFRPEEEVSAFISPLSILARKTPSVYTNLFGNKILIELKRKVIKDYFG